MRKLGSSPSGALRQVLSPSNAESNPFTGPVCFVTPHAARRYRQLIYFHLTEAQAVQEIEEGITEPLFKAPASSEGVVLYACLNLKDHPFVAACDPAPENAEFLLVRTVGPWWYWHEIKPLWRPYIQWRKEGRCSPG
jgi:hypothetical protein